ncbi:hypothetical protein [Deinococcus aetherius]|uniref:hypothetical protein n=1 Tax=Deinococcus aetherius TaxID=200252 RepID=UPI00223290F5|nr:hypothetical protein [Deinococcus aetherius]
MAYLTGVFGGSAERSFPDPALFADLWVRPSLEGAGSTGLVAEVGGQVVGYVLGAAEQSVYSGRASSGAKTNAKPGSSVRPRPGDGR